jgi:hypothetical protein
MNWKIDSIVLLVPVGESESESESFSFSSLEAAGQNDALTRLSSLERGRY